ncbi:8413_t:CDS:2, partial [Funneliformis mosseae]
VKIAYAMTKGTKKDVENIMKNVNKELSVIDNDKQEDGYTSSMPINLKLHSLLIDNPSMGNPFIEEEV